MAFSCPHPNFSGPHSFSRLHLPVGTTGALASVCPQGRSWHFGWDSLHPVGGPCLSLLNGRSSLVHCDSQTTPFICKHFLGHVALTLVSTAWEVLRPRTGGQILTKLDYRLSRHGVDTLGEKEGHRLPLDSGLALAGLVLSGKRLLLSWVLWVAYS